MKKFSDNSKGSKGFYAALGISAVMIGSACYFAYDQSEKMTDNLTAKQIQTEKEDAIRDIRQQVAILSVDIAEKVLRKNLDTDKEQMAMIDRMLDELTNVSKN